MSLGHGDRGHTPCSAAKRSHRRKLAVKAPRCPSDSRRRNNLRGLSHGPSLNWVEQVLTEDHASCATLFCRMGACAAGVSTATGDWRGRITVVLRGAVSREGRALPASILWLWRTTLPLSRASSALRCWMVLLDKRQALRHSASNSCAPSKSAGCTAAYSEKRCSSPGHKRQASHQEAAPV